MPEPVCAVTNTSHPCNTGPKVCDCTGVGRTHPKACTVAHRLGARPKVSKVSSTDADEVVAEVAADAVVAVVAVAAVAAVAADAVAAVVAWLGEMTTLLSDGNDARR